MTEEEKILKEEYGIEEQRPEDFFPVFTIQKLPDFPPIFREREPRIKVSPYAKFDKYHKKKRK